MHENLLVFQIGLEHASAGVRYFYRKRASVHFEDSDILELVSLFFANTNLSSWKLIDHLIVAKKRHRVTGGEVEKRAAQFFLRELATGPRIIQFFVYSVPTNIHASVGPDIG